MQMAHEEYVELKEQLESDFNSVYRRIDDCGDIVTKEESKIKELKDSIIELKVEQAKTNIRLGVLIGILSAIAVPILGVCIKLLFGS
jgi:predicted RNase H-like nuclease (RuvC/YqgF family)